MQQPLTINRNEVMLNLTNLTFLRNPHYDNRIGSDSQAATKRDEQIGKVPDQQRF